MAVEAIQGQVNLRSPYFCKGAGPVMQQASEELSVGCAQDQLG